MVGGRAGALLADDGDADAGGGGKSVFLADLNSVMQKRQLKRAPTHKFGDEATDAAEAAEATDTVDVTKQLSTGSSQKEKSRAPAMSESYAPHDANREHGAPSSRPHRLLSHPAPLCCRYLRASLRRLDRASEARMSTARMSRMSRMSGAGMPMSGRDRSWSQDSSYLEQDDDDEEGGGGGGVAAAAALRHCRHCHRPASAAARATAARRC